jgi:hypothetical protein
MKSNRSETLNSKDASSVTNESAEDLLRQGRELENAVIRLVRAGALSHSHSKRPELDQEKIAVLTWFNQVHVRQNEVDPIGWTKKRPFLDGAAG